jgi:predicted branched-subunit amino acid permease
MLHVGLHVAVHSLFLVLVLAEIAGPAIHGKPSTFSCLSTAMYVLFVLQVVISDLRELGELVVTGIQRRPLSVRLLG